MCTRTIVQVLLMCTSGFAQLYFHRLIMIWAITLKSILVFETIRAQSSLSIFAQKYAKILILSYKISILTFMKIVLERGYLEMIAPLVRLGWPQIALFWRFHSTMWTIWQVSKKIDFPWFQNIYRQVVHCQSLAVSMKNYAYNVKNRHISQYGAVHN